MLVSNYCAIILLLQILYTHIYAFDEEDTELDEETPPTHNDEDKEDVNDTLGKIRVSIGKDITIDTAGKVNLGSKTPLIIIAPVSVIDYERLYNKMKINKKDSTIVTQEKLAMADSNSRLSSLYNLKEAESRLAFYKADKAQLEFLHNKNREKQVQMPNHSSITVH